jgi:uncharacterized protein involved in outer membrane biogenesis
MIRKAVIGVAIVVVLLAVIATVAVRLLFDAERVRSTIERQISTAVGEPVSVGGASLSVWPRAGVTVTDLAIGDPPRLVLGHTEVSTALGALLSRRIEDGEITIKQSELNLPELLAVLGRASSPPSPPDRDNTAGDQVPALTLVNVRRIRFSEIAITAGDRRAVLNLDAALSGDRLEIESASVSSDLSNLTASGVVESISARKATLAIEAESLDLDGLLVFAREFAGGSGPSKPGQAPPTLPGADTTLDVKATRGRIGGAPVQDIVAKAHLTGQGLTLEPFSLGIFDGRVEGTLKMDTTTATPEIVFDGRLSGIDMRRLTAFAGQEGSITGSLGGALTLAAQGLDPQRSIRQAKARGTVAITDGTMPGLELVRSIVLAFGKPSGEQPAGSGEAFGRLGVDLSLADGVVTLSNLSFGSRDVDLTGSGTLALAGSLLQIAADARLSRELTAQAGRDLVRYAAEDGQVTVPVQIGGSVPSPTVGVDVAAAARRAATNEFRRRIEGGIQDLLKPRKPPQ